MHIIKVGGNELDVPGFAESLGRCIQRRGEPTVVVHGGGRAVSALQRRLGIRPTKVDGLRVTDAESLEVAAMVLCGVANKRLVATLRRVGLDAIGLSGVDGGLVRAERKSHRHDLGFVGQVVGLRTKLLSQLVAMGYTVVLAPISLGADGHLYNVNADEVASALAIAAKAQALSFVTNVPGVMRDGALIDRVSPLEIDELEREKVVEGGMVPKLHAARDAALAGVSRVRIVDLAGLSSGVGTLALGSHSLGRHVAARSLS